MKVLADSLVGQEGVPEELYQEFMRDITAEIDRENRIITDLLTLVKMDKKSADLQISHMDINQLLEDILKRLRPIADKRNIDLILDSFRPVEADVDELKFTSAISNLVENAIKYNVDDGWVRVSLDADHKFFYVTVADSGMGIPEDSIDRIFERFYRVDKSHSREIGGTGLGLAIVKKLVVMMHGTIEIHSKLGEGTGVILDLPLTISGVDAPEKMPQAVMAKQNLEGRRVLLAEDNEINTFVARRILESKGIIVEHAENGKRAVEMVEQNPEEYFDAIVMDIRMPVMSGLEAARQIRAMGRTDAQTVPIIAMTANAYEEDVSQSLAAGMNAHLAKPIEPQVILDTLAGYIGSKN